MGEKPHYEGIFDVFVHISASRIYNHMLNGNRIGHDKSEINRSLAN